MPKNSLNKIYIYPATWKIEYTAIAEYLTNITGIKTELRRNFFEQFNVDIDNIAREFGTSRIFDLFSSSCSGVHESYALASIEKNFILEKKTVYGILYDAQRVCKILRNALPEEERGLSTHHIIFLDRLIATHEGDRYHARVVYCSIPSIISTLGLIQAPARPKEFYQFKNAHPYMPEELILEQFKEKVLGYEDPRLTEVAKGIALQTVLWIAGFEPFCTDPSCKLYNAHWQEELINSQINGRICPKHARILKKIKSQQKSECKKQ